MLNKEHQIFKEFVKNPWKKFTFKEIKKLSGKKSESYVYNSLKKFVKSSILKEERVQRYEQILGKIRYKKGKQASENFLSSLVFLYSLGKIKYYPEEDIIELLSL